MTIFSKGAQVLRKGWDGPAGLMTGDFLYPFRKVSMSTVAESRLNMSGYPSDVASSSSLADGLVAAAGVARRGSAGGAGVDASGRGGLPSRSLDPQGAAAANRAGGRSGRG